MDSSNAAAAIKFTYRSLVLNVEDVVLLLSDDDMILARIAINVLSLLSLIYYIED